MIKGAQGVAVAAAIGNLLQGWDGGAIAGTCPVCEQALPHLYPPRKSPLQL
jgi:hypothetical protein